MCPARWHTAACHALQCTLGGCRPPFHRPPPSHQPPSFLPRRPFAPGCPLPALPRLRLRRPEPQEQQGSSTSPPLHTQLPPEQAPTLDQSPLASDERTASSEHTASSPPSLSAEEACAACSKLPALNAGGSPHKPGGGGPHKPGGGGISSGKAAPRPSPAALYLAACACWPTLGLRLLSVAAPLLLLLLPWSSAGHAQLQAHASRLGTDGPLSPLGPLASSWLCALLLGALQLPCTLRASTRASWRLALAADAAHLALVAGEWLVGVVWLGHSASVPFPCRWLACLSACWVHTPTLLASAALPGPVCHTHLATHHPHPTLPLTTPCPPLLLAPQSSAAPPGTCWQLRLRCWRPGCSWSALQSVAPLLLPLLRCAVLGRLLGWQRRSSEALLSRHHQQSRRGAALCT